MQNQVKEVEVFADLMLEKVFYTLMENSLRHGQRVQRIRISDRREEDSLVIVYEDDGIGIAEENKELIFARGFGTNSGLGLFFSREILDLTHIIITEAGRFGHGVRFEITVPYDAFRPLAPKNR